MARLRTLPSRRAVLGVALLLLLGALAAPGLAADLTPAPRTYAADVTPTRALCAGVPTQFVLTLTNTSTQQQLGSADVRPGFTVTAASPGTLSADGTTIQLRNLSLPPLAKVDVVFTGAPTSSSTIGLTVKQANNFNGPPGNDFARLAGTAAPSVTVAACELAFVTDPDDAETGAPIPGVDGASGPRVGVVDPDGEPVAVAGVPITVALATNPVGGALAGTTTVSTGADGLAAFPDLRIDRAGLGYQLGASSPGFYEAESDRFNVFDELCPADGICRLTAGTLAGDELEATASGRAGSGGGGLSVQVSGYDDPGCAERPDVSRIPSEITLVGLGLLDKTVAIRVADDYHKQQPNNGVSFYQICARPIEIGGTFTSFRDRYTGELVGLDEWGFLPDCGSADAPCVLSRNSAGGGGPLITVRWGSGFRFR